MHSVVFFNNKGGVGKTTLVCNVASHLATRRRLRVLLVDCDPQCNSTQLVLSNETWSSMYWEERDDSPRTLIDIVQPLEMGDAAVDSTVSPILASQNRFGID